MKNQSATSLLITWMRPHDLVLDFVTEYVVTYRAVKVAETPVYNTTLHTIELDASSTFILISELESYTTYSISVTPIASDGKTNEKRVHLCWYVLHLRQCAAGLVIVFCLENSNGLNERNLW